ncbi:putative hydrolase of the HAD superfamily [Bathymodiolus platifrons methanotrophic gill symbiont]|uniref:GMP/IMP nucleotidase n=1 Tax=Bathymodiolus platifrons methanotrophic gill symbiont TaxID=113268 RepID=UPI000B41CEE5|nr:GMP/IMP nucleotidase [Bathymodiolus platifrons methanotrophic gill symbiont]MCK5870936.1 GMP/IMP nucleotidase [Methyloprofundus sp.]TXK92818.1 HAD family hydrolase [Methylococcaceae bacterium CS4]TXK93073.1 HAD family hydrolase [Methylococcaceae bacterium CS5]TXK94885.1 HAD family hydrolase [Methylococcaceae bacterium HT1]TXL02390.1 HAD family hydrolase [Methylococcaceae bacterium CS3]TXL02431.1 HAD family hydrolase [Methylococcaceae bacterium CS1]TXL02709.1 HAD family hydrolase [Methyloc
MLEWNKINTVLLDMDGTLLDLNFDNHFWLEFIPERYALQNQLTLDEAVKHLVPLFKSMEGKLEWYCLDYWSEILKLDIAGLKAEISGLISVLPHVTEFLNALQHSNKEVLLVTNAHRDSLSIKMEKTCLQPFFNDIICSHDFGFAKEHQEFWEIFQNQYGWDKQSTLMIDDSLAVLRSAKTFGIKNLISITRPDSKKAARSITEFPAIHDFREIMPGA